MSTVEKSFSLEERELFEALTPCEKERALTALADGEPSAYVFGKKYFFRHYFHINRDCLIPRPDTERVVECCLELIPKNVPCKIADLCAGCGVIGLTLLDERKLIHTDLYEINQSAREMSLINARELGCLDRADFILCNLLRGDPLGDNKYSIIVSNPPYLTSAELLLYPELEKEPSFALDGGEAGTDFYRRFLEAYSKNLEEDGAFVFEIGYAQRRDIEALAREHGFDCRVTKDYGGNDRVALLRRKE